MNASGMISTTDLIRAGWLHVMPRRRTDSAIGLMLLSLAVWALWMSFQPHPRVDLPRARWVLLACLLYLPTVFLIYHPYKCRREFTQRKDLHSPLRFQITEEGIGFHVQSTTLLRPWGDYHKWREGRAMFLLYFSDTLYQMMPKRFFSEPDDVDKFRTLLQQHVRKA